MSRNRVDEILALKTIAETLNISNDMHQMLEDVLKKLLEVTGLTTGWIFLVDEKPEYTCVVDHNLPPALSWGNKTPMCSGECWCIDRYWSGRLKKAVNIINCKRIENAIEYNWGDTAGIHHHATVPLEAGGELFGILNVAAPGKDKFSDEELALLQSVAFQIGTAIKRTKLYYAQQKRAANYSRLGEFSQQLGSVFELDQIPSAVVELAGSTFDWPTVSFFVREDTNLLLRAIYPNQETKTSWKLINVDQSGPIGVAIREDRILIIPNTTDTYSILDSIGIPAFRSAVAIPLKIGDYLFGVLFATSPKKKFFDEHDIEFFDALSDHISLVIQNSRLYEQKREFARLEERNRLARDLHDSVCQNLFSLTLIAKGTESIMKGKHEILDKSLEEIQKLTQETLSEMRSLIWQLRPAELEKGLLTALKHYGEGLGLKVSDYKEGVRELPRSVEETLWRIGQEALNNACKHSGNNQVSISLRIDVNEATLEITDFGKGFEVGVAGKSISMGMLSMRERADQLGGTLNIDSQTGKGTTIRVTIPYQIQGNEER